MKIHIEYLMTTMYLLYYYIWDEIEWFNKYAFMTRCFVGGTLYILLDMLLIGIILYDFWVKLV